MWDTQAQLRPFLAGIREAKGWKWEDPWAERVLPQIKKIVYSTVQSVQEEVMPREKSFELFGFVCVFCCVELMRLCGRGVFDHVLPFCVSPCLCLALSLALSLARSLSLSLSHTHTHTYTHSNIKTLTNTHTLSLTHTQVRFHGG